MCVKCQREFTRVKCGQAVIDMFSSPPQPYKLWMADRWKCQSCGVEIIVDFGSKEIAAHYEEAFASFLASFRDAVRNYEYGVPAIPPPPNSEQPSTTADGGGTPEGRGQ